MTTTVAVPARDLADPPRLRPNRTSLILLAATGLIAVLGIPLATTVLSGTAPFDAVSESYPGFDVTIPTTVFQAVADSTSLITFGALVMLLFLRDATPREARHLDELLELRVLRWSSSLWALAAFGMVVSTPLDSQGAPLSRLLIPGAYSYLYQAGYLPAAWTVTFVASLLVCGAAWFATRWTGLLLPLWATAIGVLAPVVVGHLLVGPNHDFGSDAGIVETIAAGAVLGVIVVAAIRAASGRLLPLVALRRLFLIAAVGLPIILAGDLVIAGFELAGSSPFASTTGWQLLARILAVVVLLTLGGIARSAWHRGRLTAGRITALLTAAAAAAGCWVGVGAAMARIPPRVFFVPTSISQVFMGFDVPDAPTAMVMLTQWRPNLLFLAIAVAAVSIYLIALRTLHRRGDRWPVGRTASWILGWAIIVAATSSGLGTYSAADFGIHMVVHMILNMLAPGLLVLGGIVTLLLRATHSRPTGAAGLHDWITWVLHWPVLRFVYNPLIVFAVFIGSYYALYLTPGLFGDLMRFHWAHQLMNVHFLIVGYLYYSLIVGVDRPPRPLPHIGKLGYVLAAMPFHAFFGIILMTSTTPVGELFYHYLDLPWADLQASEYVGGGVAWAGGEIPLMIIIVILAVQWGRQDDKEAKRKDRHLDAGQDDEFEAYNRMLTRLTERRNANQIPRPNQEKQPS